MTKWWLLVIPLLLPLAAGAATIHNDDSCDIALLPAATLLLPYFEVDLEDANGENTLFTVTNVSNFDQVARVTLWTDRAYPVLSFDIYLTGYDMESISLFDLIARGVVARGDGPSRPTGRGIYPDLNAAIDRAACMTRPRQLPPESVTRMQQAFTAGQADG